MENIIKEALKVIASIIAVVLTWFIVVAVIWGTITFVIAKTLQLMGII